MPSPTPRPNLLLITVYDLEVDPHEMRNVAGDPRYAEVEAELRERLRQFQEETNDPILQGPIPRPPGEAQALQRAWDRVRQAQKP